MTKKAEQDSGCIEVKVLHRKARLDVVRVRDFAAAVLKEEGVRRAALTIVFVSDPAIRRLNKTYLSKDSTTDVLAFDLKGRSAPRRHLCADIIISADTARALSLKLGVPYIEELCRYVAHGILHLTGYDDLTPREKKKMWHRQEQVLEKCL